MENLIKALFPEGYRKVMVSMAALIIGVVADKFGGGLSDNLRTSLIALVAIFTGGNAFEHLSEALKFLKGTKLGAIVEDVVPGDQGLRAEVGPVTVEMAHAAALNANAGIEALSADISGIKQQLNIHAQNTQQIVGLINQRMNPSGPPKA